jgi:hypothetical protein
MWDGRLPIRFGDTRCEWNIMTSDFSASVRRPLFASQRKTSSSPWTADRTLERMVVPEAKIAPLSTYRLIDLSVQVELKWSNIRLMKTADRIGESGDPCGVPPVTSKGSDVIPLKDRMHTLFSVT